MGTEPALTLREIVARLGGEAVGEVATPLTGVATLDSAGPRDIAFLANPKYRTRVAACRAGAVILSPADRDAGAMPRIVSDNPYAYYARTVALFHPEPALEPGIHPFAQIEPCRVDDPELDQRFLKKVFLFRHILRHSERRGTQRPLDLGPTVSHSQTAVAGAAVHP